MAANQTEWSRLEQKSVIRLLVAQMCKPCVVCTDKKKIVKEVWLNMNLLLRVLVKKKFHEIEKSPLLHHKKKKTLLTLR